MRVGWFIIKTPVYQKLASKNVIRWRFRFKFNQNLIYVSDGSTISTFRTLFISLNSDRSFQMKNVTCEHFSGAQHYKVLQQFSV